jgi:hypothetical protein
MKGNDMRTGAKVLMIVLVVALGLGVGAQNIRMDGKALHRVVFDFFQWGWHPGFSWIDRNDLCDPQGRGENVLGWLKIVMPGSEVASLPLYREEVLLAACEGEGTSEGEGEETELIVNGTFDSDLSGWTVGSGPAWIWSAGTARDMVSAAVISQTFTEIDLSGKTVSFTAGGSPVGGALYAYMYKSGGGLSLSQTIVTPGNYSFTIGAGSSYKVQFATPATGWTIDNVSILLD